MSTSAAAIARTKVGRNDACPCGSGRKFKHCCGVKEVGAGFAAGTPWGSQPPPAVRQRLQSLFLEAKRHFDARRWGEAIAPFREIVRLDPMNPQVHHDLGMMCLFGGRPDEAALSLERAVELRPGFGSALEHLATALLQLGREREALLAYRRLGRSADDPVARQFSLAMALKMEGRPEEAEKELRDLIALAPQMMRARALLGELLSDRGMFEEAAEHLTKATENFPPAFQQLTQVKRMTEADRPLIDRMRGLADGPHLDVFPRINVHFALGKAYDDLGDYAEAMRHCEEANRLKATSVRLDRAALAAKYDGLIAGSTAEALQRARQELGRPAGAGDELPVFIVGMPRSGTTLVEQILSSHPAVAAGGELNFWSDRLHGLETSGVGAAEAGMLIKAAEDYRAILSQIGPQALRVTDKRPGNFESLWLFRLVLPGARVIHCRRDPVDTCLSIFFANFSARLTYACDRGDLVFFYRQYERLMDHWRRVLPPDRFTEVEYETLIADREAETRRLIAFCGLDWNEACLTPERNGRVVKTASLWQARQPVYATSVGRWRRYSANLRSCCRPPKPAHHERAARGAVPRSHAALGRRKVG
jgi:tetratricopeptide (TPR) repeat protein